MGIWGYNLLDNDAALDIKAKWEKELKKLLKTHPEWEGQDVVNFYLENHFDDNFEYGDIYHNSEILALAKLLYNHKFELPQEFKKLVETVVSLELQKKALAEWDKPQKRKKALLDFLDAIKGSIQSTSEIKQVSSLPEYSSKDELLERINSWLESDEKLEDEYPLFLKSVDKLISSRLGFDYDSKHIEVTAQRMMLLAFYVGWLLDLPKKQIQGLVQKAKEKVIL